MSFIAVEKPKGEWHVFKQDAAGRPTGEARNKKPYASKKEAMPFLRALYAAERDQKEPVAEFDLTLLDPSGAGWDPVFPQDVVHYVTVSPDPNATCSLCAFYAAPGFCNLVASYPLTIEPGGWCDKFTELSILADPAGIAETEAPMSETPKAVPPLAVIEVPKRAALDDLVISEYRGTPPDVPDAPGIDKAELVKGDSKPTFVTRPIAQVGRTSKNGILYDQALIDSIREQINANHPGGIFGHIKPEDRATAHPQPQAYWIGAKQIGDKLYAKAYIADPERAADIRRKKALNSADGTSIYGTGVPEDLPGGARRLNKFVLESLDFAPVDRASLDMGKEMYITSEMSGGVTAELAAQADNNLLVSAVSIDPDGDGDNDILEPSEDNEMASDVLDPKVGLTANWKTMLPGEVCEEIAQMVGDDMLGKVAESYLAKKNKKAVAMEMEVVDKTVISEFTQQQKTVAEQTVTIAELKAFKVNAEKREFNTALSAAIAGVTPNPSADPKLVKATAETRTILEMKARLKLGESVDASAIAETVAGVVTDSPAMMEMWRDTLMGPSARVVGKNNAIPAAGTYYNGKDVNDPTVQDEARQRVGI